jgi:hypothetical protein
MANVSISCGANGAQIYIERSKVSFEMVVMTTIMEMKIVIVPTTLVHNGRSHPSHLRPFRPFCDAGGIAASRCGLSLGA